MPIKNNDSHIVNTLAFSRDLHTSYMLKCLAGKLPELEVVIKSKGSR